MTALGSVTLTIVFSAVSAMYSLLIELHMRGHRRFPFLGRSRHRDRSHEGCWTRTIVSVVEQERGGIFPAAMS